LNWIFLVAALAVVTPRAAHAEALLVVEADTGKVLQADNATMPWYPASVTKIMTAYVTLKAVKEGAHARHAADGVAGRGLAVAVEDGLPAGHAGHRRQRAEDDDGEVGQRHGRGARRRRRRIDRRLLGDDEPDRAALGMTQTSYVNPNGLPADGQITSARDLAILARAVIRDLPEYEYFMHIPSIRFGRRVTQNFNKLIGRYPGADGFKTGFICASGYNLVASATRNGKRLIAVVLGATLRPGARGARGAIARARLRQATGWAGCAPRSAPSTIWCRSTPRRRTCATRCAAASASGRPATRTRTSSPPMPARRPAKPR
jgi:D-alanyl-D-alanine carboxypeptidase